MLGEREGSIKYYTHDEPNVKRLITAGVRRDRKSERLIRCAIIDRGDCAGDGSDFGRAGREVVVQHTIIERHAIDRIEHAVLSREKRRLRNYEHQGTIRVETFRQWAIVANGDIQAVLRIDEIESGEISRIEWLLGFAAPSLNSKDAGDQTGCQRCHFA